MSEAAPPPSASESASTPARRFGAGPLWAGLYGVIALVFVAAATYMHAVQKIGLMQPQVLFPSLGAVWFVIRAALALAGAAPGGRP
jgi:hypothetical protein